MEATRECEIETITREGEKIASQEPLLEEHRLDVYVNEQLVMKVVCTPSGLEELVLGRLLSEGYIRGMEDVQKLYLCDQGYRARVYVEPKLAGRFQNASVLVPTCCTDNAALEIQQEELRETPLPEISWQEDWIFALADTFAQDTKLHKSTAGTHSCMLAKEGRVLVSWEDIGRHNAMDKAIGWGMKQGIDLGGCMLYTSGRMPMDMVRKAIRAGIPVLAGKAVPTAQSVELAKKYGLTLIGGARPDRMKVYAW